MKKIITMLTVMSLITILASCGKETTLPVTEPKTTVLSEENSSTEPFNSEITVITPTINITDDSALFVSKDEASAASVSETAVTDDPSQWSKEEIINFYKAAAKKTHPAAKSKQVMVLEELIINDGDGALGFFIKILEPAIASVIEKNALEFDG